MKHISFAEHAWTDAGLEYAYTTRFAPTPVFTQKSDHVENREDPNGPGGYENISLLTRERYQAGTRVTASLEFEGRGAPIIMLAEQVREDESGALRFDDYFEVVLYRNGVNVWRLYPEDGKVVWHKLVGVEFPVSETERHTLSVKVNEKTLEIDADGKRITLWVADLPAHFHVGIDACEGINRFYDLKIEASGGNR